MSGSSHGLGTPGTAGYPPMTEATLHLEFLATGGNQHVFVARESAEDGWVYKVPAAFGYLLPWDHPRRLARKPPRGRLKRVLYRTLFAPPAAAASRQTRWAPATLRDWIWAQYIRWNARNKFTRMIRLMEELGERGQASLLVPFTVERRHDVILHVDGRALPYRGVLLMQRRAEFRKVRNIIDEGNWRVLIEAQHRLWRNGVAVADVVRYTSWVTLDGRICLADADSLTSNLQVARSYVSESVFADEAAIIARALGGAPTERPVGEYLTYIREHINRDVLDRLWRADLAANRYVPTGPWRPCPPDSTRITEWDRVLRV
jgi:hypothetical protein